MEPGRVINQGQVSGVPENGLDMHEKWIDELRRGLGWRIARQE